MTRPDFDIDEPVPPVCRPTVDRLQLALDGELPADALDADPHPAACAACRERIAAARLLLSALPVPPEPVSVPAGLTDGILGAVRADRRARSRRRAFAGAGGLAVAAAVVVAVWLNWPTEPVRTPDVVTHCPPAPTPEVAPEPRPVGIGSEFARASQHFRDSFDPITEPAAAAPVVLSKLTDVLTRPAGPVAAAEPARTAIAEIPDAALEGLEPVTGTAQKAFARLLRDVGSVQITAPKPKS